MTGIMLLLIYTYTAFLLRLQGRMNTSSQNKQRRLVCVCFGLAFSFTVSFMIPACYSLHTDERNDGIFPWHFKIGFNILIGMDFILQPCIYHLNLIFAKKIGCYCCVEKPPSEIQNAVRKIISQGLVVPVVVTRNNMNSGTPDGIVLTAKS